MHDRTLDLTRLVDTVGRADADACGGFIFTMDTHVIMMRMLHDCDSGRVVGSLAATVYLITLILVCTGVPHYPHDVSLSVSLMSVTLF